MERSTIAISLTFVVYLIAMLVIGYYAYLRTKNSSDYFLGGRSLGPWPAALSAGASDMSGWLLLGLPGAAYASGLSSIWLAAGLLVGTWLNWSISAKRLRTFSIVAKDSLTIPEYFVNRFQDPGKLLQSISAFFILLFFLFYTSSGLVSGGKLFHSVFGLDYHWAVVLGTVCVVSYTLFGGFLAVSWTDLVQGLLMAAALVAVPIFAIQMDGYDSLTGGLRSINPELLSVFNDVKGHPLSLISIVSSLAWGLGYFGQPHILARFKATRSNKDIKTARRIAVTWTGISMAGALLVGLAGLLFIMSSHGGKLSDPETIFMVLVNTLFHPVVAGILLAAVLAAIMSTADSQLLVSSSALAEDIYHKWIRPEASSSEVVLVGRLGVIVLSVTAMSLAMDPESSVLGLVSYAWGGFGAAFGPVILLSLFWKRMNRYGALAGVVVGGVTVVLWKQAHGGIFDLYEIVPGFVLATLAVIVASLLTPTPSQSVLDDFGKYQKGLDADI